MRIRAAQLACLLLLLSSVGAAEASARRADYSLGGHYITELLQQAGVAQIESPLSRQLDAQEAPATYVAHSVRSAWTMRPPAAHCIQVHAVTSGI